MATSPIRRRGSRTAATTPHVHMAANGSPFRNGGTLQLIAERSGRLIATTTTGNLRNHRIAFLVVSFFKLATGL